MKITFLLLLTLLVSSFSYAQTQGELKEYNRNSLATMMIYHPEDEFCKDIYNAFENIPFPDKYDNHNLGVRYIDFNCFYGLKKNNETYAFRSQNESELEENINLYSKLLENNLLLRSNYYHNNILLHYYYDKLGIDKNLPNAESLINAKLSALSKSKQKRIEKNKPARGLNKAKYGEVISASEIKTNALAIERTLNENNYGNWMVAKWFNFKMNNSLADATFNVDLIKERGNYNATEMDVAIADASARGRALLSDAGEELINNTFVLVNDITYITAEEEAQAAKIASAVILGILGGLSGTDMSSTMDATAKLADSFTGFKVKTHSYLYQLVWNDSIASIFYTQHFTNTPNIEKMKAFIQDTSTYKLKYVAHEYEYDKKTTFKGKYDRNQLIEMVTTRSIDKNIAALQLAYEDFKVKTPIFEIVYNEKGRIAGYAAKIGLKEGIEPNSSFQVVRREFDPETNRTTYKYVATLKPVKDKIWDNRYNAGEENPKEAGLSYTLFKKVSAVGEILPGMLLIEGKYKQVE